ncbi:unnamed protein product [Eruca vesicaria subsp. sativa]|uniref:Remorin C-terminal domain-containing protein n=1 Tax=Eruca vesicaria subsp. sativa TaxID=29727 RepID=A0ABC8JGI4_ERUVS|nr:unnamed protein product [Eruca vesicaria subsp. sativa]
MGPAVELWKEREMEKTRNKYEKLSEMIRLWEDKKKKKAKKKLHRTEVTSSFCHSILCITIKLMYVMNVKRGVEKAKLKAKQRFIDDNERIEIIVASARTHAYESQMKEELKVKEKANLMRTTGRSPCKCL